MNDRNTPKTLPDDALRRRIARFIDQTQIPRAINSVANASIGTDLGSVRKENQDRALVMWASYPDNPTRNFKLAVVSNGIGGLARGGDAASIALSVFVSRVLRTSQQFPVNRLINAALAANSTLFDQFQGRAGATLSAVFIGSTGAKSPFENAYS
jgi:serine/threonine protein phosphatase PrpC